MDNSHRSSLDKSIRLRRPSAHDKHRLADIDDLAARLRFVPARGEVWFDDRRMVLLHNSSLDAIRRELIETVGIEKACGLITRMGYQSGTRDGPPHPPGQQRFQYLCRRPASARAGRLRLGRNRSFLR